LQSGRLDAVGFKQNFIAQRSDDPYALLDEVDRRARQFESQETSVVGLQGKSAALAEEQAGLFDLARGQSVASIARAA
jgi:hypothetical protein